MNHLRSLRRPWRFIAAIVLGTCQVFIVLASTQSLVREMDDKSRLEVQRPPGWFPQERPNSATRFMYGFEGQGYGGNCNINLVESPSTSKLTQAEVDESENRKPLSMAFFESNLRKSLEGAIVSKAVQTQIGEKWGHLVEYSHSTIEPSTKQKIHIQTMMFSHSQPGRVMTYTCAIGATTVRAGTAALRKEQPAFFSLVATSRFVEYFEGVKQGNATGMFQDLIPKKELGPVDRWRYESCRESAIKAPTTAGVNRGLRICDERFNQ